MTDLRSWLERELTPTGTGGAQVVVSTAGEIVVAEAFGSCPETGVAIDSDTRFPWYSASKPVSAAALHLLAEAGTVCYDRPLSAYLPDVGGGDKAGITLRHLLNHTAGLADVAGRLAPDAFIDQGRLRPALAALVPEHAPGEQVVYHPLTATALLALVCEEVTGVAFAELVQQTVLDPLGMTTVGWHPDDRTTGVRAADAVLATVVTGLLAATSAAVIPGGGLYGSAGDLARFYDGVATHRLLRAETVAEMTRLAAPFAPGATVGFGLHVIVGNDPRHPASRSNLLTQASYGHPGWTCTLAVHEPAMETTIVVLSNLALGQAASDARLARVCTGLLDVVAGRPPLGG